MTDLALAIIAVSQVVLFIGLFLFYRDHKREERRHAKELELIRENQKNFVPVLDRISETHEKLYEVVHELWDSRHTREAVLESHERQEASQARIEEALKNMKPPPTTRGM